ncbi:MAG: hypothetical protein FJ382_09950 [Verrucomicrobia bacterium]|nr:hypothetical protein [Verrucomicrobiota bacterium]
MKLFRALVVSLSAAVFAVGVVFAAENAAPKAKPEGNPGKCCVKAESAGKTCDHKCCVEANAAGKNCEKCGGANPAKKA